MENQNYIASALELHLFFARIMKEHAIFLKAAFTPRDSSFAREAEYYQKEFESVLLQAVQLSDGILSRSFLNSGEMITEFTDLAEKQTQMLTGIPINSHITHLESRLQPADRPSGSEAAENSISELNRTAMGLLDGFIRLKETILTDVLRCRMFTANYPLMLEHIRHEAELYRSCTANLEKNRSFSCQPSDSCQTSFFCQTADEMEKFWNTIMKEHALFIRGLLDPAENELIRTANRFAENYMQLLSEPGKSGGIVPSLEETLKFRIFKTSGVRGIEQCQIRSIILPLLADHVLREANHYIRLLRTAKTPVPLHNSPSNSRDSETPPIL